MREWPVGEERVGMCTLSANCRGHVKRKREAQITGGGVDVLKYMSIIQ